MGSGNNVLPAVTPVQDMVEGTRILHSHRARHGAQRAKPDGNVNHRNEPQPWRSANLRFNTRPIYSRQAPSLTGITGDAILCCMDGDDNHVLELAIAGGVEHLVTHHTRDFGRGELRFAAPRVVTPAQHLKTVK